MKILTIRIPGDKHDRRRHFAKHSEISADKLIEELAAIRIVGFDAGSLFPRERTDWWRAENILNPHGEIRIGFRR